MASSFFFRRRIGSGAAVAIAAMVLAACGSSAKPSAVVTTTAPTSAQAPTTAVTTPVTAAPTTVPPATVPTIPTTTTTPSTVPAGPQPCTTPQLVISLSPPNGAAGSTYATLELANDGTSACTLSGYPGVSAVTGSAGTQVGAPAARDTSTPLSTVTLAPGATGTATLREIDPLNFDATACQLTPVVGLRVYPPGQTAAAFIAQPGQECASSAITTMFIGALQPS